VHTIEVVSRLCLDILTNSLNEVSIGLFDFLSFRWFANDIIVYELTWFFILEFGTHSIEHNLYVRWNRIQEEWNINASLSLVLFDAYSVACF
jgi:hypothetical protein